MKVKSKLLYNFLNKLVFWDYILILISITGFVYLFDQNFIFSSSLNDLPLREVDDYAFQSYLREAHEGFKLIGLNAYAYGWLYWFPLVITTYPFYYLSVYFGIDVPLIVIPRQMSLIFCFASAFVLYRLVGLYTKDAFIKFLAVCLFLSFPFFGFIALRFGTIGQVMFFSILTIYLAARPVNITPKDCYLIAFSMACAGATKLSGLLVAPIAVLLVLDHFCWKFSRENIILWLKSIGLFLVALVLMSQYNPVSLLHQLKQIQTNFGGYEGPINSFLHGIAYNYLSLEFTIIFFIAMLCFALFPGGKQELKSKRHLLIYSLTLIPIVLYLIFRIRLGTLYISNYFSSVSYLLCLGFLSLTYVRWKFLRLGLGLALLILAINANFAAFTSTNGWARFSIFAADQNRQEKKQISEEVRQKIQPLLDRKGSVTVLRDYETPTVYVNLYPFARDYTAFSNMQLVVNNFKEAPDVVAFYKKGSAFYSDEKFEDFLGEMDQKEHSRYKGNRVFIQNFIEKQSFRETPYQVLLETDTYLFFKTKKE